MSSNDMRSLPTIFLLGAQYGGLTVIPLRLVCRDYFPHLTEQKLLRKCLRGNIDLPIYRAETGTRERS